MNKPLLIIGSGGHASVLVDILRQQNREIVGLVSPDIGYRREIFVGIERFNDGDVSSFNRLKVNLVNGIGALPGNDLRSVLYNKFKVLGYEFETIIASNSIVSNYAQLEEGVQVLPNVVIQTGARIFSNTIINTGAIIEHDCIVGNNNHIAPGVTLSGQVVTSNNVHIGTGASVIQSVTIGQNSIVGAGCCVTKNVAENVVCFPSRTVIKEC